MHARPRRTDGRTDRRTNIMAIARRFVLTNASRAKNRPSLIITRTSRSGSSSRSCRPHGLADRAPAVHRQITDTQHTVPTDFNNMMRIRPNCNGLSAGSLAARPKSIKLTRLPFNRRRMCVFSYARMSRFCSYDLDLDPMTLTYELDLRICRCTCIPKMKFLGQGFQKLEHEQDIQTHRHTHRCDRNYYHRRIRGW